MASVDLHVHSNASDDGEYAPEELVAMAKVAGIKTLAIADHNTVAAVEPAFETGRGLGVAIIPAIEIDCRHQDVPLHILGYCINFRDARFRELHESVTLREREASGLRIRLVEDLGFTLDRTRVRALAKNGVVTGEMIAEILLADSDQRAHPLLRPFLPGGQRSDNPYVNFYWDICSPGKPAYVPIEFMTLTEAIGLIGGTGGKAVVAHPGLSLQGREDLLGDLAAAGVRGVEAFSSYHHHSADECEKWLRLAGNLGLFVTCGSDFHGKTKPAIRLGVHGGDEYEGIAMAFLDQRPASTAFSG